MSDHHDEVHIEAIPGLPHELPRGEHVIWQGRPQWKALARETFSIRWLAGYFGVFAALRLILALDQRGGAKWSVALDVASAIGLGVLCLAILFGIGWLTARATIYTITSHRVVFRIGVALPMTWNLPFKQLLAADLAVRGGGDGDIMLRLAPPNRIAWLHLWPHVAPWKIVRAQPTLRAIAEPEKVARLLGDAFKAWGAQANVPVSRETTTNAGEQDLTPSPVGVTTSMATARS